MQLLTKFISSNNYYAPAIHQNPTKQPAFTSSGMLTLEAWRINRFSTFLPRLFHSTSTPAHSIHTLHILYLPFSLSPLMVVFTFMYYLIIYQSKFCDLFSLGFRVYVLLTQQSFLIDGFFEHVDFEFLHGRFDDVLRQCCYSYALFWREGLLDDWIRQCAQGHCFGYYLRLGTMVNSTWSWVDLSFRGDRMVIRSFRFGNKR